MATDDEDRKVKDLIDAGTRAELERWFGLPSYTELEERGEPRPPPEDPEILAVRERRAKAIEAVDPAMLERHRQRMEANATIGNFKAAIDVVVDPTIALLDDRMIARGVAEPRETEIPQPLLDDLRECAPQALLRDLHRPEMEFEKFFEVIDMAAEQRIDVVAAVAETMAASWRLEAPAKRPFTEGVELLAEIRADRYRSWAHALAGLPNRRVTE